MNRAKHDAGKPQLHLLSPRMLTGVAKIRMYGVEKYKDPNNWKQVDDTRYIDAALRHILEMVEKGADVIDIESGLPAVDHAICSLMFVSDRVHEKSDKRKSFAELLKNYKWALEGEK